MKILNKLVYKNLKLNKTRTIVTIIGIILSCALITTLAGLVTSTHETFLESAKADYGNRHVTFYNVEKEDIGYFTNNKETESYYMSQSLGYSLVEESANLYKPYIHLVGMNEENLESSINLLEGRYAESENEIVITEHMKYDGLMKYKVGDTISLELGNRIIDGEEVFQNTEYSPNYEIMGNTHSAERLDDGTNVIAVENGDNLEEEYLPEQFVSFGEGTKEYTIVGIAERPNIEPYSAPGYTVITRADEITGTADISILLNNPKDFEAIAKDMSMDGKYFYDFNDMLLEYIGVGFSSGTMTSIYMMAIIVAVIIILTSVFCIRNSFAISIGEKTRQFGMIASMGATPKQIKRNVLFEGVLLGGVGISLGVLFGIGTTYVLIALINNVLSFNMEMDYLFKISWAGVLLSVVVSALTIYLSCISSARRASKITEIEAIRATSDIKNKKVKVPKFISKNFGVIGELSYKSMKRNNKKYRVVIASITVSVMTFIAVSSFMNYGYSNAEIVFENLDYNVQVGTNYTGESQDEIFNDIMGFDYVDESSYVKKITTYIDENNLSSEGKDETSKDMRGYYIEDTSKVVGEICSVGEDEYRRYIEELGFDYNDIKDKGILYNENVLDENYGYTGDKVLKEGIDTLEILVGTEADYNMNLSIENVESLPMGCECSYGSGFVLVVSDEMFANISEEIEYQVYGGALYINSSQPKKLIEKISEYEIKEGLYLYVNDMEEYEKQMNSSLLMMGIFIYGFIAVVTLIGVTSIFNTISTSMRLRRNEFAILQSVGTTKKEFNKLIILESGFYGVKALLIGIPLGLIFSHLLYVTISNATPVIYQFPIVPIIIAIIFVFAIIFMIMKLSMRKINKQNIIETIRNENI